MSEQRLRRNAELSLLHLVRVRDDPADEDVARARDGCEPRRHKASGAGLGGCDRSPRSRQRSSTLSSTDASLCPNRYCAIGSANAAWSSSARCSAPGSTNRSTWISKSRAQIVISTPPRLRRLPRAPVRPRIRRTRRNAARAARAARASRASRRNGSVSSASGHRGLELARRPGKRYRDPAVEVEDERRRSSREPDHDRALRDRRLLPTPGAKSA